jgi:hypothetical protein
MMILPGTKNCSYKTGQENKISFKNLYNTFFQRPIFQSDIDENKVEQMVESYLKNPDYFIFKNKLIVAIVNNEKLYLIDGQHRLNMIHQLYLIYNIDDMAYICYFNVNNDEEMRKLFNEINKDSYKNQNYISLDDFKINIYDLCKIFLEKEYGEFFSKKKNTKTNIYTIGEFVDKIINTNYFLNKSIENFMDDLKDKNNIFYKLISYQDYFIEDKSSFYVDEHNNISNRLIFSLKNNNFIDYFVDNNVIPDHRFKYKKQKIQPKLRIEVWRKEFGNNDTGKCPLCCNIINNSKNGFHCSHIISEYNGGKKEIDNLRPLCEKCNLKMGKNNWI